MTGKRLDVSKQKEDRKEERLVEDKEEAAEEEEEAVKGAVRGNESLACLGCREFWSTS